MARYYSGHTIARNVYFVRLELRGIIYFKIGMSSDPVKRAKTMRGELVYSEPGTWHDEHFYHQWFAHLRIETHFHKGIPGYFLDQGASEWFIDLDGEIQTMLDKKATPGGYDSEILADGVRRAAAEIDYQDALKTRFLHGEPKKKPRDYSRSSTGIPPSEACG